jgi:hypothetical protein
VLPTIAEIVDREHHGTIWAPRKVSTVGGSGADRRAV